MSRRRSTSPQAQIISQVVIDTAALATSALRYPGGFVTNCRVENIELMQQAADLVGVDLKVAEPKLSPTHRERTGFVGIYLTSVERAPDLLLEFQKLQLAQFVEQHNDAQNSL